MLDDNDREVIEAPTLHPRLPEVLNGSFPFFDVAHDCLIGYLASWCDHVDLARSMIIWGATFVGS